MTVRIAVIGAGLMAVRYHLPELARLPLAEVVAICNAREATARAVAERFQVQSFSTDWREVVRRGDVDAVDILTPNALHAPIAIAAARAGKHVLVEKPLATSLADADAMLAAAREAGVLLMTAMNLRFVPLYEAAHAYLSGGALGRIVSMRGVFGHAGPERTWGSTSPWFWDTTQAGGGALLDLGIHMIDLLRWLSGLEVVEVMAMLATLEKPVQAEDTAMALLRFDGGAIGLLEAAWTARPEIDRGIVMQGTRGVLHIGRTPQEPLLALLEEGDRLRTDRPAVPEPGDAAGPATHFITCINEARQPRVGGAEGRADLAVILAAYESARSGRLVRLTT